MTTEEKFLAAVEVINSLPKNGPFQPSEDMMLKFTSCYKQATAGPCVNSRPPFFDYRKKEWYAWKNLGDMTKEDAMKMYVEQLLKVIETMSYTEAVSRFIDLMGPFYEIVWTEDLQNENAHCDCENSPKKNQPFSPTDSNYSSCDTIIEDAVLSEEVPDRSCAIVSTYSVSTENISEERQVDEFRLNYTEDTNLLFNGDGKICSLRNHIVSLSKATHLSTTDKYANKVLSASVLNLQKSLDDIVMHLDSLESLAKKYKNQILVIKDEDAKRKWWHLSPLTIALVIFWPFVVHWIVHSIRQHRKNVS